MAFKPGWRFAGDIVQLRKVNTIYLEHISKNTEPILIKNTAAATKAGTRENSAVLQSPLPHGG